MERAADRVALDLPTDAEMGAEMGTMGVEDEGLARFAAVEHELAREIAPLRDRAPLELEAPGDGVPAKRHAEREAAHLDALSRCLQGAQLLTRHSVQR